MEFQNPFFSWAGQKERLSNALSTIKSAVTLQGVTSNTGNKVVDTALSKAASNPYATSGVVATILNPVAAFNTAKTVVSSVVSKIGQAFIQKPVATTLQVGVGVFAAQVVSSSKTLQEGISKAPSKGFELAENVGKSIDTVAENITEISTTAKETIEKVSSGEELTFDDKQKIIDALGKIGVFATVGLSAAALLSLYKRYFGVQWYRNIDPIKTEEQLPEKPLIPEVIPLVAIPEVQKVTEITSLPSPIPTTKKKATKKKTKKKVKKKTTKKKTTKKKTTKKRKK